VGRSVLKENPREEPLQLLGVETEWKAYFVLAFHTEVL